LKAIRLFQIDSFVGGIRVHRIHVEIGDKIVGDHVFIDMPDQDARSIDGHGMAGRDGAAKAGQHKIPLAVAISVFHEIEEGDQRFVFRSIGIVWIVVLFPVGQQGEGIAGLIGDGIDAAVGVLLTVFQQKIFSGGYGYLIDPVSHRRVIQKVVDLQVGGVFRDRNRIFPAQVGSAPGADLGWHITAGVPHACAHQIPVAHALRCAVAGVVVIEGWQPQHVPHLLGEHAIHAEKIVGGVIFAFAGEVILKFTLRSDAHAGHKNPIVGRDTGITVIFRIQIVLEAFTGEIG